MTADPSPQGYINAGLALVKIPRGRKGPVTPGWNQPENCLKTPADAAKLCDCNIGIAHLPSGTCALDIDDFEAATGWLLERGVDLAALFASDDAVQIRSGRPNRGKLLFRLSQPLPTRQVHRGGRVILEFRCSDATGKLTVQDVVPPSIHPETGQPYQLLGDIEKIPEIQPPLLKIWRQQIPSKTRRKTPAGEPGHTIQAPSQVIEDLRSALASISSGDYDVWISVGHALHELGATGFDLWDGWSQRSEKYKPGETTERWAGFMPANTGYRAVFDHAAKHGWKNPGFRQQRPRQTEVGPPSSPAGKTENHRLAAPKITLEEMLSRYVHVTEGNLVADLERNTVCTITEFHATMRPNLSEPRGKNKTRVHLSKEWLQHPARLSVDRVGFYPGREKLYHDDAGHRIFNDFHFPAWPRTKDSDRLDPVFDHFRLILGNDEDYELFMDWVAFFVQHPERRPVFTPLLVSRSHGAGRGWISNLIKSTVGEWNCSTQTLHEMAENKFHDYLHKTIFCSINEAAEMGKNRFEINNTIRDLLDTLFMQLNLKYGRNIAAPIHTSMLMSSNFPDALIIPEEDRRIWVSEFEGQPLSASYYVDLYKMLGDRKMIGQFFWFLMRRDLSTFMGLARAPMTLAKAAMIAATMSEIEADIRALIDDPPAEVMTTLQIRRAIGCDENASEREARTESNRIATVLKRRATKVPGGRKRWIPGESNSTAWILRDRKRWLKEAGEALRQEILRADLT